MEYLLKIAAEETQTRFKIYKKKKKFPLIATPESNNLLFEVLNLSETLRVLLPLKVKLFH